MSGEIQGELGNSHTYSNDGDDGDKTDQVPTALLGPPTTATGRSLADIHAEHRPIVDAVLAASPDAAEAAMRQHLDRTCALLTSPRS